MGLDCQPTFQFSRAYYLLVFRLGDFFLRFRVLHTSSSLYVQVSSASQRFTIASVSSFTHSLIHSSWEVVPLLASPINKSNRTRKRCLYLYCRSVAVAWRTHAALCRLCLARGDRRILGSVPKGGGGKRSLVPGGGGRGLTSGQQPSSGARKQPRAACTRLSTLIFYK